MKTIYKYIICNAAFGASVNEIEVPKYSTLLKIGRQGNDICAWYEVRNDEPDKQLIRWYQIGTGHQIPYHNLIYKDSVICNDYGLVWHMYYETV